jgi:hypothetical protein
MSEIPFDLKLQPDWVKESSAPNPYARFEGTEDHSQGRGSRSGKPRFGDQRGPRDRQPPRGDSRNQNRPGGGGRPQKFEPRKDSGAPFRGGPGRDFQSRPPRDEQPGVPETPAPVFIEFLPDAACINAIARQIKDTGHAYPLFDLARLFLAKPERHRVKIVANEASQPLHQCGEGGPVALNAALLEQRAFSGVRDQFYVVETQQAEEIKGNFTRVARCKITGTLLGPSNHHSYQSALRKLYDVKFSRRMSFEEYSRNIENVDDPAVVEAWKEQARQITVWRTLDEENPATFASEADAERHFRQHHLPKLIQQKTTLEIPGDSSRSLPDHRLSNAIRIVWEKQRGYPGQMMYHLRRAFNAQGLHVFKHRKQRLYVSSHRPVLFTGDRSGLSANVAAILGFITASPQCTRADLAAKLLPADHEDSEFLRLKSALAADFHWLIQSGHLIEFQDGKLDLPVLREPGAKDEDSGPTMPSHKKPAPAKPAAAAAPAPAPEPIAAAPVPVAEPETTAPATPLEHVEPVAEIAAEPVLDEATAEVPEPEAVSPAVAPKAAAEPTLEPTPEAPAANPLA